MINFLYFFFQLLWSRNQWRVLPPQSGQSVQSPAGQSETFFCFYLLWTVCTTVAKRIDFSTVQSDTSFCLYLLWTVCTTVAKRIDSSTVQSPSGQSETSFCFYLLWTVCTTVAERKRLLNCSVNIWPIRDLLLLLLTLNSLHNCWWKDRLLNCSVTVWPIRDLLLLLLTLNSVHNCC